MKKLALLVLVSLMSAGAVADALTAAGYADASISSPRFGGIVIEYAPFFVKESSIHVR